MASVGPNYPSAASSVSPGTAPETAEAWVTPTNVFSDNGSGTTGYANIVAATYDSPDVSMRLMVSGFGFAIPAGATIDGITVGIERRYAAGGAKDYRVQLCDNGTLMGSNLADTATAWPNTDTVKTYGGAANLWGATLTPAIVNASTFGLCFSVQATVANTDIYVDYVRMTVAYTEASSGPVTITPAAASVVVTGYAPTVTVEAPVSETTMVHDTFTDAGLVDITGHTPDTGGAWSYGTYSSGSFQINGSNDYLSTANGYEGSRAQAVNATLVDDGYVQANLEAAAGVSEAAGSGLIIRADTTAVTFYALDRVDTGSWFLYRCASDIWTQIASGSLAGEWMRLSATGSSPTALKVEHRATEGALGGGWNGTETTDNTAGNQRTSGKVGVESYCDHLDFGEFGPAIDTFKAVELTAGGGSGTTITPPAATVAVAGAAPTLVVSDHKVLAVPAASIVVAGAAPTVIAPRLITPAAGAVVVTGAAPTVLVAHVFQPAAAAIVITGQAPTVLLPRVIQPAAAVVVITGQPPTVVLPRLIQPAAAAIVITGQVPTVLAAAGTVITPAAATILITGQVPTLVMPRLLTPPAATIVVTGAAPTVLAPRVITPPAATIVVTGAAPTLVAPRRLDIPAATIVVTGAAPTLVAPRRLDIPAATIVVTGAVPTVAASAHRTIAPDAASIVLAGRVPTVTVSAHALLVVPAALIAVTGQVPVVSYGSLLPARVIGALAVGGVLVGTLVEVGGMAGLLVVVGTKTGTLAAPGVFSGSVAAIGGMSGTAA